MKMFMPSLGTVIALSEDWEINLFNESRNKTFIDTCKNVLGADIKEKDYLKVNKVVIPKNSVLTFDRIYLRKGIGDYDSVTFTILNKELKKLKGRFWVKLADVNKIEYDDFSQISPNELSKQIVNKINKNEINLTIQSVDFSKVISQGNHVKINFNIPREEFFDNIKQISTTVYISVEEMLNKEKIRIPSSIKLDIQIKEEINGIVKLREKTIEIKEEKIIEQMFDSNKLQLNDIDSFTDDVVANLNVKSMSNLYYFKDLYLKLKGENLDKLIDKTIKVFNKMINDMDKTESNIKWFKSRYVEYLKEISLATSSSEINNLLKKIENMEFDR